MKEGWTSEVARALCIEVGESDLEVAIQSLIRRNLSGLYKGTIPVNLDEILEELGIDEIKMENCPGAGYLFDDGNRCWIGVNINDNEQRRRFTIAHEIMHFMLPTHRVGKQSDASVGLSDRNSSEEESLCDLGASFLLMPQEEFIRMTEGKPVTCALMWKLHRTFNVSLEAAIVISCSRIELDFLVAKWHPSPDGFMSLDKAYRSSQIASEFWLAADTAVSPTHRIARVSEERRLYTAKSKFCLKHSNRKIYLSADYLSLGGPGSSVLSVLRPLLRERWTPL